MLPQIFQSLCAHEISFVQHLTRTVLHLEQMCIKYLQRYFRKEHLCVLEVFMCTLVSRAQLKGNIALSNGLNCSV